MCYIREEIVLAEERVTKQIAGVKKPAQRKVYKDLALTRLELKKNYLEDKAAKEPDAISTFLSNIGYNVATSMMTGRVDEYEETRSKRSSNTDDNNDVSTWVPTDLESSVLEELECEDVYSDRIVGVKNLPWRNKKCPSCNLGFNSKSKPSKCHGCDSFTHSKRACLNKGIEVSQFYCKTCAPNSDVPARTEATKKQFMEMTKIPGGWKCNKCNLSVKTSYSMRRHIENKHSEDDVQVANMDIQVAVHTASGISETQDSEDDVQVANTDIQVTVHAASAETQDSFQHPGNISDLLKGLGIEKYKEVFDKEMIDLKMLLDLNEGEFMEMVRDIGIIPWGHRHTLRKAVENIKMNNQKLANDRSNDTTNKVLEELISETSHEELLLEENSIDDEELVLDEHSVDVDHEENSLYGAGAKRWNLDCTLCKKTTQHSCTICGHMVCNLFCSQADPDGSNEMKRQHLPGDPRCATQFECPSCEEKFKTKESLQEHIILHHDLSSTMPSMRSEAEDSTWKYVTCNDFDSVFQNEQDLLFHKERVHEYGELCQLYPCEHCGFRSGNILDLNNHIETEHRENLYGKRKKQNLSIDSEEDSDDDAEWTPQQEEVQEDEEDIIVSKKRKIVKNSSITSKKP